MKTMAILANKASLLIDLDRGVVGTWAGSEKSQEPGFEHPLYYPLGLSLRPKKYKTAIKSSNIYTWRPKGDEDGVEQHIFVICSGTEDSEFLRQMSLRDKATIEDLREQLRTLKLENRGYKQTTADALESSQKQLSKLKDMGAEKKVNPLDPFRRDVRYADFFGDENRGSE